MLTAICMVFERYRSLPDDRGRLCDLLIEDLCRSRHSEDSVKGWKLDEAGKKDLLQRIALSMQQQGAQSWPVYSAIDIATQLVPTSDKALMDRAKRYVDWAADHTGILRFQEGKDGEEQIRFWHEESFENIICESTCARGHYRWRENSSIVEREAPFRSFLGGCGPFAPTTTIQRYTP